jgi:hypothetical protein
MSLASVVRRFFGALQPVKHAQNWSSTSGKVISREIECIAAVDGNGGCASLYVPCISYSYIVTGREFRAEKVSVGKFSRHSYADAEMEVALYPVGCSISIRYNPDEPEESVLECRLVDDREGTRG